MVGTHRKLATPKVWGRGAGAPPPQAPARPNPTHQRKHRVAQPCKPVVACCRGSRCVNQGQGEQTLLVEQVAQPELQRSQRGRVGQAGPVLGRVYQHDGARCRNEAVVHLHLVVGAVVAAAAAARALAAEGGGDGDGAAAAAAFLAALAGSCCGAPEAGAARCECGSPPDCRRRAHGHGYSAAAWAPCPHPVPAVGCLLPGSGWIRRCASEGWTTLNA